MIVNSFQINDALQLTPFAPEKAAEAYQRTDARIWLDLQAFEPGELEEWLDKLGITGLSRQLCLEARDRSGFYPLKKEIFLVIPVLVGTKVPLEVDYLALLCRENLLLTLHRKPVSHLQQTDTFEGADACLCGDDGSVAGVSAAYHRPEKLDSRAGGADGSRARHGRGRGDTGDAI